MHVVSVYAPYAQGQASGGYGGANDFAYQAGCTANVILIADSMIYCCNSGDARSVLSDKGKAVDLSRDHKPDLPAERSRVIAAGHMVEDGRVDGIIAISRAIGDWEYKNANIEPEKMAVSAFPDISKTPLTKDIDFVLCACDGIWDCMTSQQAIDFVSTARTKLKNYTPAQASSPTKLGKQSSVTSSGSSKSPGLRAGASPLKKSKGREGKMETTIDNSKFRGLATVVEMMMDVNCPTNLQQSEGLGTDNMTAILIEFNKQ